MTMQVENAIQQLGKNHILRFNKYSNEKPEDLSSLYYGDFDRLEKYESPEPTDFYLPELLSGSDYSGGSVTVSNHRVFLEQFGKVDGVYEVYGGYSTYAVAIRLDAINEEMLDIFKALEDYPLIDEDDLSRVELEAEDEAWDSWVEHDFRRDAAEKFPHVDPDVFYEMPKDKLFEVFRTLAERSNTYWQNEEGNSAYIDLKRLLDSATEADFAV